MESQQPAPSTPPLLYVPAQLDALARALHASLPQAQHLYFRTSVPLSFTGTELLAALPTAVQDLEDPNESVHIANILLHHGYLFPVIDPGTPVKDDATLYRFQLPYFWPSNNPRPEDVEYAVYLSKRLRRNEQKHGLDEREAEAFNKLRELLAHQWDFITAQAEAQLKLFRQLRKVDRVVLDSQERVFWRLHRAEGGMGPAGVIALRYGKAERRLKKRTPGDVESELNRLRFSLRTKPWLKTPKATEMMVSWCQRFGDYDPFLSGCFPSNPWTSDDDTHWKINTDQVEIPTERRVKRWGFSVNELIQDPIGRQVLETFLETEFSSENIRFLAAVQDLKYSPKSEVAGKVPDIFEEFLESGAPCQVNVDSRTLEAVLKAREDGSIPQRFVFSAAEEHIFTLMSKDSYPRFIRSQIYKDVLAAAQEQGAKRLTWRNILPKKITNPSVRLLLSHSPLHRSGEGDSYPRFIRSQIYKDVLAAAQEQGAKRLTWRNILPKKITNPSVRLLLSHSPLHRSGEGDSYPRFIRSQIYKDVLAAAQEQGAKRLTWRNILPKKITNPSVRLLLSHSPLHRSGEGDSYPRFIRSQIYKDVLAAAQEQGAKRLTWRNILPKKITNPSVRLLLSHSPLHRSGEGDSYPRFIRSQIYKDVLAAAQEQGAKRLTWSNILPKKITNPSVRLLLSHSPLHRSGEGDSYPRFIRSQIYKDVLAAAQEQGAKRLTWRNILPKKITNPSVRLLLSHSPLHRSGEGDSYPRFIRSQIYKDVLAAAQEQGAKRLTWRNILPKKITNPSVRLLLSHSPLHRSGEGDSYPRFIRSQIYKDVLAAAQEQGAKRLTWRNILPKKITNPSVRLLLSHSPLHRSGEGDSYPRFIRSQIYKDVLAAAQEQGAKRLTWRNILPKKITNPSAVKKTSMAAASSSKLVKPNASDASLLKQTSQESSRRAIPEPCIPSSSIPPS